MLEVLDGGAVREDFMQNCVISLNCECVEVFKKSKGVKTSCGRKREGRRKDKLLEVSFLRDFPF